ncbi:MAG TPA: bile acid:sodium symporter family protein [Chthoniobacteraceae bacterium]|nr:bile acid:sodium symporter family protein [Chthoniobacteraceae bacterium]
MKWKPDWFLTGMFAAIVLALLFPGPGAKGGFLHPELLTKGGVALIFLLHGMALSVERLRAGLFNWRLHLVIQSCTFLLFPLMGVAFLWGSSGWFSQELQFGFFFLCALPSTVSSSVAMTAAARGNVAAAVFNATLSSVLGVFLTPLWVGAFLETGGVTFPLGEIVVDLICWLMVPLALGQSLRPWARHWAARNHRLIGRVDRGTILLLVYTSFCESTRQGIWSGQSMKVLGTSFLGVVLLLAAALWTTGAISRRLGFPFADRTAAVFCGSKKTLASGVPMAQLIFGTHPGIGLILLPLILYHTLQLIVGGWLANHWVAQSPHPPDP